jgi:hypothetical protein
MKIIFGECKALGEEGFFTENRAMWLSVKVGCGPLLQFFLKKYAAPSCEC